MGLSKHPLLISRSQEFAGLYGSGSGSSRSVCGNLSVYEELEHKLALALNKPAALIFGSGFQANLSLLEALLDPQILGAAPLVFCDKYCHISLLLGAQKFIRFKHNDLTHLKFLLEKHGLDTRPKFIIVESVYSMEGDEADLPELISIAKQHHAFLYVDDAHAAGVYGWGKAVPHADCIDLIMGTFSKALGSYGAYIGCSIEMKEYMINRCRGFIYSTGLPPAVLGAISAAIDLVPVLHSERERLWETVRKMKQGFLDLHLNCGNSSSHIIPWIIGDAEKTLFISQKLETQGILTAPIRPPSVPSGKSRLRFCPTADHTEDDIKKLLDSLS